MRVAILTLLVVWALYPEITSAQQEDISILSLDETLLPADTVAGNSATPMPDSWQLSSDFERSIDGETRKNSRERSIDSHQDIPCDERALELVSILAFLSGISFDGALCEWSP